ncbi:hypothetical protein M0R72_01600 [Candidatus Pacearchaeota archaeon]|jgi:hypothetical protein|nr:hypothetical protein [Candidatus Pacearchaeota archaeon]
MTTNWAENDELFFSQLKEGFEWQKLPKLFFELHGLKVEMPELTIRDSIADAGAYMSSKDLIVNGQTIETKSRNEAFTYPLSFPYKTLFVDTVSGFDGKKKKPLAYVFISRPTGSLICLMTSTISSWTIEEKFDRVRKITDRFYLADRKLCTTLDELVEALKAEPVA